MPGSSRSLQVQLGNLMSEKFNGVICSASDSDTATKVYTSTQGASGSYISIGNLDMSAAVSSFAAARYFRGCTISATASGGHISLVVQLQISPVFVHRVEESYPHLDLPLTFCPVSQLVWRLQTVG